MSDPFSPTGTTAPSTGDVGVTRVAPESIVPVNVRVDVVVDDLQGDLDIDVDRWAALAAAVLTDEGVGGELTLTFVDRDEMTALNTQHMGGDGPTDVLSFPMDDTDEAPVANVPVLLGDVVVCPAVAAEAAPTHAGTIDDELALLTVHGVLHILGHDHAEPDETAVMRAAELDYLTRHHWRGPAPSGFLQEQM